MTEKKRKQCHLRFKAICGPKASNCEKYLILLVTVLFTREEWLHLLMLLKTGLPRQKSEKSLQIRKHTSQYYDFGGETVKELEVVYSSHLLNIIV